MTSQAHLDPLRDGIETRFDPVFATTLALREKQVQQSYRPLIGIHKWFARRPGSLFRSLLLSEFSQGSAPLSTSYWESHQLQGTIADPFMGGGTTLFEANRMGLSAIGVDINPMSHWLVRQALAPFDAQCFRTVAEEVTENIERQIGHLYTTQCTQCESDAPVKYFIWVKTEECPSCHTSNDLFPGYLLAEAVRHPKNVVVCAHCSALGEFSNVPTRKAPGRCKRCRKTVTVESAVVRQRVTCRHCRQVFPFPQRRLLPRPPVHRLWAIEYHCHACKPTHTGRFFKAPDKRDVSLVTFSTAQLGRVGSGLPIPDNEILEGDETRRLHRWGYRHYRELFNDRQLLTLGLLLQRIRREPDIEVRHALLTVFSDSLRYQNLLCRYDTYALKCQDIFSVHGFPVGLVQCENNVLGIPGVGSGGFRHFVQKYLRAKEYCVRPFDTTVKNNRKVLVHTPGEVIEGVFCERLPSPGSSRAVWLTSTPADDVALPKNYLDGVFTDPPYFDNVQYAELMDFCFSWLRLGLPGDPRFRPQSTRHPKELTGNDTLGRGLEHFADGLSTVFRQFAGALKPGAPFVFTYHHNDALAYLPIVISVLDANLTCTAALPAAAEMGASLHISGTASSTIDSVFVCRSVGAPVDDSTASVGLHRDLRAMRKAGVKIREGDVRCLLAGHLARLAVQRLRATWKPSLLLRARLQSAEDAIRELGVSERIDALLASQLSELTGRV